MITTPIPDYTHYCRAADSYGVLLFDLCASCGGITAGPTRYVIPRDQMSGRSEKRVEQNPGFRCLCLMTAGESEMQEVAG